MTRTPRIAMIAVTCAALAAGVARADEPETPPRTGPFYGWQVLGVDIAGGALMNLMLSRESEAGVAAAGVVVVVAGPAVHVSHGETRNAWISLGLRTLAPAGGAAIGLAIGCSVGDCTSDSDLSGLSGLLGAAYGGVAGWAAGLIADWVWNSRERLRPVEDWDMARAPGLRWIPAATVTERGAVFGVAGSW